MTSTMKGGVKLYRGNPTGARAYVEAGHSRARDYYLAEGSGTAEHYVAAPGSGVVGVERRGDLDGETYEKWVHGFEVSTSSTNADFAPKGKINNPERAVRFAKVVVNGPKTWSLAATLHPEVATAYDEAQERAAVEIIGWLADHSTTRVGPRGRQVQVPVERGVEAAVVRHYTSRAGDPHRHLHLQVSSKVWVSTGLNQRGAWRALHTVGTRDSIDAINGIGHAAVMCDPDFRVALARQGYSLDDEGEVRELKEYAGRFSQRARQIGRNIDRYEAEWRTNHPGQEPGPSSDGAGTDVRGPTRGPTRSSPRTAANSSCTGMTSSPTRVSTPDPASRTTRDTHRRPEPRRRVDLILSRLGAKKSAWNAANIRGQAEQLIASVGIVAERAARTELAEDLTSRALAKCRPLLTRTDVPEHIRCLTSDHVLAVAADINDRLIARASQTVRPLGRVPGIEHLDAAQQHVVQTLAGDAGLLVIEGAAGTGKTTTLAAARAALDTQDRRLVVVTPTLKAAEAAAQQVGTDAYSAAWLIHQHGWSWDDDGHWTHTEKSRFVIDPPAVLRPGDVLLVDEAGMLDQSTARALLTIADQADAGVAFLGDRHQLPAVGRGGVLDLAARWAKPEAHLELESVHRFTDPAYADLSLLIRDGERPGEVFDALVARGEIVVHASEVERTEALATIGAVSTGSTNGWPLIVADTREQVGALNAATRDARQGDGGSLGEVLTSRGEAIGLGDRIATRRNDRGLGVANRETWTVIGTSEDRSLLVSGRSGQRELPSYYVSEHVELAFAVTAYGAQGDTVDTAHLVIGEATGAASAYVGMTRGRHHNVAHLVAESVEDARAQWVEVFGRDRADLGPAHAAESAADDIERYGPMTSHSSASLQAAALGSGVRPSAPANAGPPSRAAAQGPPLKLLARR